MLSRQEKASHMLWPLIVVFIASLFGVGHSRAEGSEDQAEWENFVALAGLNRDAVRALEYTMKGKSVFPEGGGFEEYTEFGREDVKYYINHRVVNMTQNESESADTAEFSYAYDGQRLRTRRGGDTLLETRERDTPTVKALPTVKKRLEFVEVEDLVSKLRSGAITLESARREQVDGQRVVSVAFTSGGRPFFEASYDLDRGCWPIKAKLWRDESSYHELEKVVLEEFVVEGNEHYFPVSGASLIRTNGKIAVTFEVEVAKDSVRINHDIPDSMFTLVTRPDEVLYDEDLRMVLRHTGEGPSQNLNEDLEILDRQRSEAKQKPTSLSSLRMESSVREQQKNGEEAHGKSLKEQPGHSLAAAPGVRYLWIMAAIVFLSCGLMLWRRQVKSSCRC